MRKRITEKLSNCRGDSIAEVLVALLISAVALVMLASMISSSSRLILQSKEKMTRYDKANNALAEMSGAGESKNLTVTDITDPSDTKEINMEPGAVSAISVNVYENEGYRGNKVIAYKKPG